MSERKKYKNPDALRKERIELIRSTVNPGKKAKRIPIISHAWTWKAFDAGYSLKEYLYDYEKTFDAVCKHHEKYEMDLYIDMGARNPIQVTDQFGPTLYVIDEEKNHLSIRDYALMDEDDYENLIELGLVNFYFERGVPFRYGITDREEMIKAYGRVGKEYQRLVDYNKRVASQFVNDYGVPNFCMGKPTCPMDTMINVLRGIQGLSMDMHKHKKLLKQALEVIDDHFSKGTQKVMDTYDIANETTAFAFRLTLISHTVQNKKQFGEFSWPFIKQFTDNLKKNNMIGLIFTEGSIAHLTDYFRQIPEGTVTILLEQDDPVEMKKKLPNVTIAGGYPTLLLNTGTKQECVDQAKRLIDEMAYDGNYMFSVDKMMSFPEDGKGENLLEVVNFVKEYGRF